MKLQVFGQEKKDEIIRLKLMDRGTSGDVTLVAVDKNGEIVDQGYILSIQTDGTIYLHCDVSPDLGFKLTDRGEVETC
jgi:maltose-binding protein MalE